MSSINSVADLLREVKESLADATIEIDVEAIEQRLARIADIVEAIENDRNRLHNERKQFATMLRSIAQVAHPIEAA